MGPKFLFFSPKTYPIDQNSGGLSNFWITFRGLSDFETKISGVYQRRPTGILVSKSDKPLNVIQKSDEPPELYENLLCLPRLDLL